MYIKCTSYPISIISGSIKVSMGACHALDPGSIPGWRVFLFLINLISKFNYLIEL